MITYNKLKLQGNTTKIFTNIHLSLNFIVMFDQKKPTCAIYVLHSRQGQSLGDQDLMKCLNLVNDLQSFI